MPWQTWILALTYLYVLFAIFWLLQWWLGRHIQGLGLLIFGRPSAASKIYFYLLAPGVILHEFSHWLMAKLLRVPTGDMALFRPDKRGGRGNNGKIVLGYVEIFRTDPLRSSLIGLAPLLMGLFALLILAAVLNFQGGAINDNNFGQLLLNLPGDLVRSLSQPLNIIWLYLVFSVSNGMLPSAADRRPWLIGFFLPSVVLVIIGLLGWFPPLSVEFQSSALGFIGSLAWIFAFAATINLVLALIIVLLEYIFSRLTRRRVVYNKPRGN